MRGRRFWAFNGALLVIVAVVAYFGLTSLFHKASAHGAERTATVTVGTVSESVTASGNISPDQSENVSFAGSGTVTSVNVAVGQQVTAGQTLATLDPSAAQAALTAAQDNLTAAQDNLAQAQGGNETPPEVDQDDATVASDQASVTSTEDTLAADQATLAADQAACSKADSSAAVTAGSAPSGGGSGSSGSSGTSGSTGTSGSSGTGSQTSTTVASTNPCTEATAEQQTVDQDQSSVTQAENNLDQENLSIAAKRYVSPATILQDEAQVTTAQETVTEDQKTLSETTLVAPFSGTVTALNGAVGETVSGGGNSAASASSGSSSSGESGAGATSTSSSSSSSSSSGFLTIDNLSGLQVVAGVPEASAVKVKVGQPAEITLSATNAETAGSVTAISPTPTVVSNVVEYDVTISLTNPPSTVQNGMSATVAITVDSVSNALELPSSAITTTGTTSTVQLIKNGKETTTTITTGVVGDTDTQILSGLSEGDEVVEPSVSASATTGTGTTGTGRAGLFGGGAAGGAGGGGAFFAGG